MPDRMRLAVPAALVCCGLAGGSCARNPPAAQAPAVELTRVPVAAEGGPDRMAPIAGRARGARPGQRIVLYARSGPWWVQPLADQPFTEIRADGSFENTTHLGTEYAALLVEAGYRPPEPQRRAARRPAGVAAVAVAKGVPPAQPRAVKTLQFAGYEWRVRDVPSERGGWTNRYDPENAWTDAAGALHLRIAPASERLDLRRGDPDAQPRLWHVQLRGAGRLAPAPARSCWACSRGTTRPATSASARWTSRPAAGATPRNANLQYVAPALLRAGEREPFPGARGHAHAHAALGARACLVPDACAARGGAAGAGRPSTSSRPACRCRETRRCA